jgi:hypothetical protein
VTVCRLPEKASIAESSGESDTTPSDWSVWSLEAGLMEAEALQHGLSGVADADDLGAGHVHGGPTATSNH